MTAVVFIADDNPADVDLLLLAFEEAGMRAEFVIANDGLDAMRKLPACQPTLILLDIKMPGADGFQVLAMIREDERLRSIPVTVMSSSSAPQDQQRSLDLGANQYWVKPGRFQDLVRMVKGLAIVH